MFEIINNKQSNLYNPVFLESIFNITKIPSGYQTKAIHRISRQKMFFAKTPKITCKNKAIVNILVNSTSFRLLRVSSY